MTNPSRLTRAPEHPALSPDSLRRTCPAESFEFESTAELEASRDIIGQERALRAIALGLEMDSPGYNIFLAGFVGTGRNTTIRQVLKRLDRSRSAPDDLCYVFNFAKPEEPVALFLPPGHGRRLRDGMENLVRTLRREVPHVLERDAYREGREKIIARFRKRQRSVIEKFDARVQKAGFALVQVQLGPVPTPQVVPVVDGEPKGLSDLEEAVEAGKYEAKQLKAVTAKLGELTSELGEVLRTAAKIDGEMHGELTGHEQQAVRPVVAARFDLLREEHADLPEVLVFLGHAEKHALEKVRRFLDDGGDEEDEAPGGDDAPIDLEYRVNVLVDHHDTQGPPVIVENAPTASRLFGNIERKWAGEGEGPVDHTKIQAGSLHAANGGYLVLNATDLFGESPVVWHALKRTLRTGRLELLADPSSFLGPPALKPQPVCISVKVVLIGDAHLYSLLYAYDEDFKKIFKVRADFDTEMAHGEDNVRQYGAFVQRLVGEEGILPYHRTGLARVVEYGGRLAGRQDKLSTRFHQIADLLREASYFARKAGGDLVRAEHVDQALEEKDYRNNLPQEKMQEMIEDGTIFIDVTGAKTGELNGLAVYDSGEYGFGLPSKITATVSLGNAGVINIEREAELSGRIHDKGVQILAGWLRAKFAQDKPLTLSASICFEQSYSGVEGDSASSTEIYAILSALAGIPLRQDLAVTGSMNQAGEVQPIGGVNEKIEGFFDVCRARGLTGTQGVLIPAANVVDLMLHARVLEACHEGRFRVYPVGTIDQGVEILTGVAAGELRGKRYPANTVYGHVDLRLRKFAAMMRDFGGGHS
jgi:ATP-dependent Lon protease